MRTKDKHIIVRVPFMEWGEVDQIQFSETPLGEDEIIRSYEILKSRTYESPKIIVVGVVVVAIPGITACKFRRRRRLVLRVREDILKKNLAINSVSGEEEVELTGASREELQKLKNEMSAKQLLHSSAEDENGIALIAAYLE